MRTFFLLAAFLSAAYAQVVAGTFGNAACESDYTTGVQALYKCGYTISLNGSVALNAARSVVEPCVCKPDNVNGMNQIKSSCSSVSQVDSVLSVFNLVLKECTALANGSPLPTTKPTSTAVVPTAVLTKQCETAQNNLMTTWGKCGVTNRAANMSIANQQDAVKCVCKNLNVVEDVLTGCGDSVAVSSQKSYFADIRTLCAAQGGATQSGAESLLAPAGAVAFAFAASLFM
ncbi:hypothetical protein HDU81_010192 [Chytriomyces hyalinus]|nr:hypothetical protein HDU81_010192 [Chytriomyces hyalinus]